VILAGKGAVVTGGGRGIGAEVARSLVEAGARVVISARSGPRLEATTEELRQAGGEAWAVPCDVTEPDQVQELARRAAEHLGRADILINNAGIAHSAPLKAIRLEDWNRLFAVNVTGVLLCTQAFLPAMLEAGWGRIVNVASIAGRAGAPYIAAYAASKHAVVGFTRSVAAEVAARGVTANAVCPGYVDTEMTQESVARIVGKTGLSTEQAMEHILATTPQRRLLEAAEVAFLVLTLCDPRAKGVNGQSIILDGGAVQS
jgi:3-hydroxybutyrate dehydrogenase